MKSISFDSSALVTFGLEAVYDHRNSAFLLFSLFLGRSQGGSAPILVCISLISGRYLMMFHIPPVFKPVVQLRATMPAMLFLQHAAEKVKSNESVLQEARMQAVSERIILVGTDVIALK